MKIWQLDRGVVYITELVLRNSPLEFGWKEILHQNSKHAAQGTIIFSPQVLVLKVLIDSFKAIGCTNAHDRESFLPVTVHPSLKEKIEDMYFWL